MVLPSDRPSFHPRDDDSAVLGDEPENEDDLESSDEPRQREEKYWS